MTRLTTSTCPGSALIAALSVTALVGVAWTGPAVAGEGASGPTKALKVKVKSGDTLLKIAGRNGVSLAELREWNPSKVGKGDLIKAGDTLIVRVPDDTLVGPPVEGGDEEWEGFYDIKSGDTLGGVARKLDVGVADLRRWNRLRDGQVIRSGQMLRYVKTGRRPAARSDGRPTKGKLFAGQHLGKGRGYRLRFPKNAFGIPSVLKTLRTCSGQVADTHAGTADILIGDISRPTGGRFPPHVSHQSGRDADIGYYIAGNQQNATMYRVGASHVDHDKNWTLLRCLLVTDRVVRVYMDHRIQAAMARHLAKKGALDDAQLARLFEVRAAEPSTALIRHASAHDTHIHVRFACDSEDAGCIEEPDDTVYVLR